MKGLSCGIDVVEIERFRQVLQRSGEAFEQRVFTEREIEYANQRPRTRLLHLAARFAAKEAVIKAVSQLEKDAVLGLHDIEITVDAGGRPAVALARPELSHIEFAVSLTHSDTLAIANAIAVKE